MTTQMHAIQTAGWRSGDARLRSRVHVCSTVIANAYGMKPAANETAFTAIVPSRRGVPPQ